MCLSEGDEALVVGVGIPILRNIQQIPFQAVDAVRGVVAVLYGSFVNSNMVDCYNREATVVGSSIGTGGLIGSAKNSKMLRCESTGRVEGSTCVGGLVGVLDKTIS